MEPNTKLPPFTEPLMFIKIINDAVPLAIEPLGCDAFPTKMAGNFNDFMPGNVEFDRLAIDAGQSFAKLINP